MVPGGISREILGNDGIRALHVVKKQMQTQELVDNFCDKSEALGYLIQINHNI